MTASERDGTPVAPAAAGFTLPELEAYWRHTHSQIARDHGLAPAIVEAHPWLVNRFDDFAHRLGMRANFRRMGDLRGLRVLDLGCGRGRWAAEYARRGARVTGVDWSEEALAQARARVPGATFIRMPVTDLQFEPASFHALNCVTVVQHLPHDVQARVLREAARVLVPGGWFSLVELTAAQAGPHVFPRTAEDWIELARACGFVPAAARGCCYELVFRPYKAAMQRLRGNSGNTSPVAGVGSPAGLSWRQRANRALITGLALPSFPVELLSLALPVGMATHAAMLFRRAGNSVTP